MEVTKNKANFPVSLSSEMMEALGEAEMAEQLFGGYLATEARDPPPAPQRCSLQPASKAAIREVSLEREDEIISLLLRSVGCYVPTT